MKIEILFNFGNYTRRITPSFPNDNVIAEEDEAVWAEYLTKKIAGLITTEALETPEFKAAQNKVNKDIELYLRYKYQQEKKREDYQRRKVMGRPKIAFIPKGLTVDYEKEYAKFFEQEVTYQPIDSDDFLYQFRLMNRWQEKSIPQIIELGRPDAAYAIAIELCRHIPLLLSRNDLQEYIKRYKGRIKKFIIESFSALVTAVKAWNNEEKRIYVYNFIIEQSKQYGEFRRLQDTLIQMIPSESFTGSPVIVTREMNDEELFEVKQETMRKEFEELKRIKAEKEARSLIPLNMDYESRIFNRCNISCDCDIIADYMYSENTYIKKLVNEGKYQLAALKFLQLAKSMCLHFISDEHYNYFDDMYSPEYAISDLIEYFSKLINNGALPNEIVNFLHEGWKEIQDSECYKDYGTPSKQLV